jgi:hypothetical protein
VVIATQIGAKSNWTKASELFRSLFTWMIIRHLFFPPYPTFLIARPPQKVPCNLWSMTTRSTHTVLFEYTPIAYLSFYFLFCNEYTRGTTVVRAWYSCDTRIQKKKQKFFFYSFFLFIGRFMFFFCLILK